MAIPSPPFPGTPQTGSQTAANFVPEIWSKKLQAKFYASTVLEKICNTDYEGEISGQGSKVYIRTVPTITIGDYTGSIVYQTVTSDRLELEINQAKYFAFDVDDVLRSQADIDFVNAATQDAAQQMKITVDTLVLGSLVASTSQAVDKTGTLTASDVLDGVLEAGRRLDEKNIPESDRFIVLPPKAIELLKKSDLKAAYLTGDNTSPLRNGKVGTIDRFTVYQSNNLAAGSGGDAGKRLCLAGHPKFACFASQFTNLETIRRESKFGEAVRGLKTFGFKAVVPDAGVTVKLNGL